MLHCGLTPQDHFTGFIFMLDVLRVFAQHKKESLTEHSFKCVFMSVCQLYKFVEALFKICFLLRTL